jgi:formylmethanofuran:tetrahydromethanopterin formyltransferase
MAFPLVPFAAGVAIGAVALYGWRDPAMRQQFARGGEWLYDTTVGLMGGLLGVARPAAEAAAGAAAEAVEQVRGVVTKVTGGG